MSTGMVFDLKRFAVHDGPGIRTTIFLKGCSLRCAWCHSPESQSSLPELIYLAARCKGCGACARACPLGLLDAGPASLRRDLCTLCGNCAAECFTGALSIVGRLTKVDDLVAVAARDTALYQASGGGVTISGGEPALQPEFTAALVAALKARGLHVAIETAGNVTWDSLWTTCRNADLVFFDFKHPTSEQHRRWTGDGNELILANLRSIAAESAIGTMRLVVRMPLVPGVNDGPGDLAAMADLLSGIRGIQAVEILPYHNLGAPKYAAVGRVCALGDIQCPTAEQLARAARWFAAAGLPVVCESGVIL